MRSPGSRGAPVILTDPGRCGLMPQPRRVLTGGGRKDLEMRGEPEPGRGSFCERCFLTSPPPVHATTISSQRG